MICAPAKRQAPVKFGESQVVADGKPDRAERSLQRVTTSAPAIFASDSRTVTRPGRSTSNR